MSQTITLRDTTLFSLEITTPLNGGHSEISLKVSTVTWDSMEGGGYRASRTDKTYTISDQDAKFTALRKLLYQIVSGRTPLEDL